MLTIDVCYTGTCSPKFKLSKSLISDVQFLLCTTTHNAGQEAILHPTFKAACEARGLLTDDDEADKALTQAATSEMGNLLRELFVTLLLFTDVKDPKALWEKHASALMTFFAGTGGLC